MTDDLLARARQACDRAPEGPWEFDDGVVWRIAVRAVPDPRDETGQTPMPEYRQEKVCDTDPETAEFIAAARTLVPELADALETTRAENERLRNELERVRRGYGAQHHTPQER